MDAKKKVVVPKFEDKDDKVRFEQALLTFVESNELLWNPKNANYTKTDLRDKLFAQFAERYADKPDIAAASVQAAWKSLRQSCKTAYFKAKKDNKTWSGKRLFEILISLFAPSGHHWLLTRC